MDEKIDTSSELSSEPPSIPELSGEKRDEEGSQEKDESASKRAKLQQHLDSEVVLAKDVKPSTVLNTSTCVAKPSSVSKDDDNTLPETRRGGGGVHVDAVVSTSSALERSESMRQWMEMKQNGFLSGPLGGPPVASRRPRRSRRKRRGDSSKKTNELVPKKKDQHVTTPAPQPSGLLTGMKPGIIRHVRSKEQVYSALESSIRNADSFEERNQLVPKKDQQEVVVVGNRFSNVTAPQPPKPGILRNVRSKEQVYSVLEGLIRNANVAGTDADLNFKDSSVQDKALTFTNPEQAKSLAVEAATAASQWLDFLHQDLSAQLSAAQDSRNRVDDTLKAELPLLVSSSANQESTSGDDVSLDKTVTEAAHQMKWSAKFDQFKKHLHDEEKDLESSLNQVKDMQSQCKEGLRQMKEASCGKDGTDQETNLAVQAAAASIFSTRRYLLSKMKEATPPNSS